MAKDKGVFSYAGKAHSWAVGANELLISYCVNTHEFARLFQDDRYTARSLCAWSWGRRNRTSILDDQGGIALQVHGGGDFRDQFVRYRNIRVKVLKR
ncbi:hypothetical protein AYO40_02240 [Planctomycetaceae bacterium SCGC AG-212-D15]|nr:hypothetical protein AYO40_02240 [Planctomycetaceae bacterium SCGC AG-212-D15]